MDDAPQPAWYCFHWLTWIVVAVQVWAFVDLQRQSPDGGTVVSGFTLSLNFYGWPLQALTVAERSNATNARNGIPPDVSFTWEPWSLAIDISFGLLLLAATIFVFEERLRSPAPLQFSLRGFLMLTAVSGALVALIVREEPFYAPLAQFGFTPAWDAPLFGFSWRDLRKPLCYPILLGIGCVIYAVMWLVVAAIQWTYSKWLVSEVATSEQVGER